LIGAAAGERKKRGAEAESKNDIFHELFFSSVEDTNPEHPELGRRVVGFSARFAYSRSRSDRGARGQNTTGTFSSETASFAPAALLFEASAGCAAERVRAEVQLSITPQQ